MAEHKIQLNIGGKYTMGQAVSRLDGDMKRCQNGVRDFSDAARKTISTVAGSFGAELNGTLKTTYNFIGDLARGGLWGALASVANMCFSAIGDYIQEANKKAETFAKVCREEIMDAIGGTMGKFGELSKNMAQAKSDGSEMLAVLNGDVAKSAHAKLHQLHIDTLQQMTDNMTAAGKAVIEANEAYEAAIIKGEAAIKMAENATKTATENLDRARQKREAAETTLAEVTEQRVQLEQTLNAQGDNWLKERESLQSQISEAERLYAEGHLTLAYKQQWQIDAKTRIAELEEEHADALAKYNEALGREKSASDAIATAKREEESAQRQVTLAAQKESEARLNSATAEADAKARLDGANNALKAEEEATAKAAKAAEDKAYMDGQVAHITKICGERGVEAAEYIELFKTCLGNGADETEAYAELQKKLNEELKKRKEAEEKATEEAKRKAEEEAKKNDKKNGKDSTATASATITFDPNRVTEGVKEWDGQTSYSKARQEMSNDIKSANQERKRINAEIKPFIDFMKGNYPDEQAEKYMAKLKQDYSPEQLRELQQKALERQMLSKTEQKQQLRYIEKMEQRVEKMGIK